VQRADTIRKIISARGHGARAGSAGSRPFSSSPPSSTLLTSSGASRSTPSVSVNQMQGQSAWDDEKGENWTWERQEGEEESQSEQLQQVAVRKGPRTSGPARGQQRSAGGESGRRWGSQLTPAERTALFKARRCYHCCEKGHVAHQCPFLGKEGYPKKPRPDQLKE
jgi:hypothetical protein